MVDASPALGFRVLGTVEAQVRDRTARLTGMQRSLLVILLLNANRVVPGTSLVDGLWGERAPASAAARVRTLIVDLRRALGEIGVGSDLIGTRSAGYVLRLDDAWVDSAEFTTTVARAREAFANGHPEQARDLYASALALWRGPALSDAQGPAARAEAARLEEEHASAIEGAADVDIALGRHREAVAALTVLIGRHPLRDSPYSRLMLALHRQGRSGEALQVYRSMRSRYTDELGIEPGPELRELHQRILRADPALLDAAAAPEPQRAVPAQLPLDVGDFTGRDDQVAAALAVLVPEEGTTVPVLAVYGKPGVGKTALAVHIAHRIRSGFPGGQLHVDLRGGGPHPEDPHEVLARLLGALGVPGDAVPDHPADRAALYRSRTADQRVLIVLDNAADEPQVLPLLPGTAGSAVIVTSRAPLTALPGAHRLVLDVLDADACERMLTAILGAERTSAERPQVERLVELCGRLPLALRIAAGRLAAQPHRLVRTLADRLTDERRRLDELRLGGIEVRASLELSRQALPPADARAFALLGMLPAGDFAAWHLAALAGTAAGEAEARLDTLVRVQLVEYAGRNGTGEARYRLHDLVRAYAVELADACDPGDRRAAAGRLNGAWVAMVADAAKRQSPRRAPCVSQPAVPWHVPGAEDLTVDGRTWLEAERRTIVSTVVTSGGGFAWQIAASMSVFLETSGHYDDMRALHLSGLDAAERAGDRGAEAAMRCGLAAVDLAQLHLAEARRGYERCLATYDELGDDWGRAQAEFGLGELLRWTGDIDGALVWCDRAMERFVSVGDALEAAYVKQKAAVLRYERGDWDTAVTLAESALEQFTGSGDKFGESVTSGVLGLTVTVLGDHEEGERWLRHAFTVTGDNGMLLHHAYAGCSLGDHLAARGRSAEARELFELGLEMVRSVGAYADEAGFLRRLARLVADDGELDSALTLASRAVSMSEAGGGALYAHALWALGDVHSARGDAVAEPAWKQARELFDRMGSREGPAE
ncbi:BTAD domain-containing putative transcriptional regulator [Amycolatopsis sp. NPDC058278]|uniref:AfsR/SARP family transcriptional regulator n=1 Tax=Amycolatopsis sp. NPDC058278 TaxID=3346417 RepID=UPI0036DAEF25